MVIPSEMVIGVFLCVTLCWICGPTHANPNSPSVEDLQDEYYNVIPTITDHFEAQDDADAKAIHDSNKGKSIIAKILPYREKMRRWAINVKMAAYSEDKKTRWFSEIYHVGEHPFDDCCFGLIEKESLVLGNYLDYFISIVDKQRIGFGMVLTKDVKDMVAIFDSHYPQKFDGILETIADPYKTLVKNWVKKNREPLEKDEPNHDSVTKDANALNTGGWKSTLTQLDSILFQKSIKYARAVITEFEKLNNKPIEDIISTSGIDESIASTYRTFARYIKNKHKFIAEILQQYSDGSDYWAVWIMCMAVIHPQEWPKVDEAFKQCNNGVSLTKFITVNPEYRKTEVLKNMAKKLLR